MHNIQATASTDPVKIIPFETLIQLIRKKEVKSVPAMLPPVDMAYTFPAARPIRPLFIATILTIIGITAPRNTHGGRKITTESSRAPTLDSRFKA